jgi:hypothetical protein
MAVTPRDLAEWQLLLKRGRIPQPLQGLRGDFGVRWWLDFLESLTDGVNSDLPALIVAAGGGAAPSGVTILDLDATPVTSVNNVLDTTLWSVTLPTRTYADPEVIRASLYGSFFNNSGAPVNFTLRTRFGTAQLARFDNQNPLAAGTSTYSWQLNFLAQIVADNVNVSTQFFLSIPAGAGGLQDFDVVTTGASNIALPTTIASGVVMSMSVLMGTADPNANAKFLGSVAELIT